MFGLGGDPFQAQRQTQLNYPPVQAEGGPLAGFQRGIATGLNGNGLDRTLYVPAGDGEPIFQVPNPRYLQLGQGGGGYYAPRQRSPEQEEAARLLLSALLFVFVLFPAQLIVKSLLWLAKRLQNRLHR